MSPLVKLYTPHQQTNDIKVSNSNTTLSPVFLPFQCCISGGSADDTAPGPAPPPPAAAPPAPAPAAAAPPSPEVKRKRRRVKPLTVQELDPDITNEELRSLHMMFDDRVELCGLSDPTSEASLDEPSELSDPESDAEPCFSDFLKACGLKEDKINEYMKFYRTHKGEFCLSVHNWSCADYHVGERGAS